MRVRRVKGSESERGGAFGGVCMQMFVQLTII